MNNQKNEIMGKEAVKISKLDVDKLLKEMNAALAEEWLAYYQYWIGARVMEGQMRSNIEPELLKHADEELHHAEMLVERIKQLDGVPLLSPKEWFTHAQCAYETPTDFYIERILEQNLRGERCAIERYQHIAEYTIGKDYATYRMAVEILEDEIDHEDDIESWMADFRRMREDFLQVKERV